MIDMQRVAFPGFAGPSLGSEAYLTRPYTIVFYPCPLQPRVWESFWQVCLAIIQRGMSSLRGQRPILQSSSAVALWAYGRWRARLERV